MPKHKSKLPTLDDAHRFNKTGSWSVGPVDQFTARERFDAAVAAAENIKKRCLEGLPKTRNLELLVLKCHVIIEFALDTYIRTLSVGNVENWEINLRFEDKVNVAFMLGLGIKDPLLFPSIRLLNQIRNQIAHRLTFNEKQLDELIRSFASIPNSIEKKAPLPLGNDSAG